MVASATAKHAIGFAIGQVLVSEKHDAELADYRVESAVHEWQGSRIRRLEFDPFGGTEFSSRDRQHRRIEITRDQTRGVRKGIPQKTRDDSGSGRDFKNAAWMGGHSPARQVSREVDEQIRAQPAVVVFWDGPGKMRGLFDHGWSVRMIGAEQPPGRLDAGPAEPDGQRVTVATGCMKFFTT